MHEKKKKTVLKCEQFNLQTALILGLFFHD